MKNKYRDEIVRLLLEAKKEGMSEGSLLSAMKVSKKDKKRVLGVLAALERDGTVARAKGTLRLKGLKRYFTGTVVRVAASHGVIRNEKTGEDLVVRGRDLLGAIPGDTVLARVTNTRDETHASDSAAVVLMEKETDGVLTGTVTDVNGTLRLRPDSFSTEPLRIVKRNGNELHNGDKVKFTIHERAEHHGDITADIESVYGSSDFARVSVVAYLE